MVENTSARAENRVRFIVLEEKNVLRLDLTEPREGFWQRGKGRSVHVGGLKMEKVQKPTVESRTWGKWRLTVPKEEQLVS